MKWKSWRPGYWALVMLLLTACAREKGPVCEAPATAVTGDEKSPVDILVFVDSSGSMASSDPGNVRMETARSVVERIARDKAIADVTRIGMMSFSDDAHLVAPLGMVSALMDSIPGVASPASGNTNLLTALRAGYRAFADAGTFSGRKAAIVLLTDGSPYDFRKLEEVGAYFLELQAFIEERLRPHGCAIYVLGIDVRGQWAEVEGYWKEIADRAYEVKDGEGRELALGSIIEQVYGIPPVSREVVKPGRDLAFAVPPYMEKLEVYITSQGSDGNLALHCPTGAPVVEGGRGVLTKEYGSYRALSIIEPAPGDWVLKAREEESTVYRNAIPYRLKLVRPAGVHPLGKPLRIEAAFTRGNGEPVQELSAHKLRFSGRISTPDGRQHQLGFGACAAGNCAAKTVLIPDVEGIYEVVLVAQGGDAFRSETTENVAVKETPYLVISRPVGSTLNFGDLGVEASIFQGGEPITGQELGDVSVLARLQYPAGQVSTTWLESTPDSSSPMLRGSFLSAIREVGRYRLEVVAVGWVSGSEAMSFLARRGFFAGLLRWAVCAGVVCAGLLILAALGFLLWLRRYPMIMGSISAHLSSDEDSIISQRRFYRKKWGFWHLRRHGNVPGRWLLVTGAPGGDEAVSILYRKGLTFNRRRICQDGILQLGTYTLKYA